MTSAPRCRLYLITPPRIDDLDRFLVALDEALAGGDVACLQIRLKEASDQEIARAVTAIAPAAQARDVAVILNDRPDLAVDLGCDGVHVGQSDATCREARQRLGPDRIVGVTCHNSRHLAMEACEAGADYVAFGAFFDTTTKPVSTHAEPELLTIWQETMQTPCVAIGGITVDRARIMAQAGADFVAVSAGVWSFPQGPRAAVRAFHDALCDKIGYVGGDSPRTAADPAG